MDRVYKTLESIKERAEACKGVPFGEIDKSGLLFSNNKGGPGQMIQQDWFGIAINNRPEPDFAEMGIELKVTSYIYNTRGLRAKERLVCNMINYEKEETEIFEKSSFWKKNRTILVMYYHNKAHEYSIAPKSFDRAPLSLEEKKRMIGNHFIEDYFIYNYTPQVVEMQMRIDWKGIASKIRSKEIESLSEKNSVVLAASRKGKGKNSRAYALKQGFMTYLMNEKIIGSSDLESILNHNEQTIDIKEMIRGKMDKYKGMTVKALMVYFNESRFSYQLKNILVGRMLDVSDVEKIKEFKMLGITYKAITVNLSGSNLIQHISFPRMKFSELLQETWEESSLKQDIIDSGFMFAVFKEHSEKKLPSNRQKWTEKEKQDVLMKSTFEGVYFWKMPETDYKEVIRVWSETQNCIAKGGGLQKKAWGRGTRMENDLPKAGASPVLHVRPHTSVSSYVKSAYSDQLPSGEYMTIQSFWLKNKYIFDQLKLKGVLQGDNI